MKQESMKRYRMCADASVYFDILAENEDEAIAFAKGAIEQGGHCADELFPLDDARVYPRGTA